MPSEEPKAVRFPEMRVNVLEGVEALLQLRALARHPSADTFGAFRWKLAVAWLLETGSDHGVCGEPEEFIGEYLRDAEEAAWFRSLGEHLEAIAASVGGWRTPREYLDFVAHPRWAEVEACSIEILSDAYEKRDRAGLDWRLPR